MIIKQHMTSSTVTLISLKKFLELVPEKSYEDSRETVWFNTITDNTDVIGEKIYTRKMSILTCGCNDKHMLSTIFSLLSMKSIYKTSVGEMVQDAYTTSIENMGKPTHMVRLTKRTWMMANIEDFQLFESYKGTALAIFNILSNSIIEMRDYTEEDFKADLAEYQEGPE